MFTKNTFLFLIIFFSTCFTISAQVKQESITKVVLLGTGNPNPNPEHSGCSVAIIVNDTPYIVDFGPGLIRKAAEMSPGYGGDIKALSTRNIKRAFLTHLHSDHTTGYPDLILTSWVMGRDEPLQVYGPEGLKNMTDNILEAYEDDLSREISENYDGKVLVGSDLMVID